MDGLVVKAKKFLSSDFLLAKSIKKIFVFAGESIKSKVFLDFDLKFFF
jgi:hypothetical protein